MLLDSVSKHLNCSALQRPKLLHRVQFRLLPARGVHKTSVLAKSTVRRNSSRPTISATADAGAAQLDAKAVRRREKEKGRQTYSPASYKELLVDAVESVEYALEDGVTRLEVDFPTLASGDSESPGNTPLAVQDATLELQATESFRTGYKLGSDDYIDANVKLALSAAAQLIEKRAIRVHLLVPDAGEYKRSFKMFRSTFEQTEGLTMGNLRESRKGALQGMLGYLTQNETAGMVPPGEAAKKADLFIAVNASCVELGDIEQYVAETAGDKPFIIWNMELDTLRADLGLFGFPSKDLQYRFLSQFKPIFYIRQREYAKTISQPPYNIGYSGALFREYPGPWQVMFKQQNGVYACVAERPHRYNLGEFKEELMAALGLNTEAEGSAAQFFRRGYKMSTWWEDDREREKFSAWRS